MFGEHRFFLETQANGLLVKRYWLNVIRYLRNSCRDKAVKSGGRLAK
jgi:hypothetical protein